MVVSILTSKQSGDRVMAHESIAAIAQKGLADDRYATGKGYYTGVTEWDAHVTLIEQEVFDDLKAQHQVVIDPAELRRNLVTRGVSLASLVGKRFRVGEEAIFRGRKPWPPCQHIVRQSGRDEIFKYLARKTGIGADIEVGGTIRVGDAIEVLSD